MTREQKILAEFDGKDTGCPDCEYFWDCAVIDTLSDLQQRVSWDFTALVTRCSRYKDKK